MEQIIENEEQPNEIKYAHTAVAEENNLGAGTIQEGSSLGKFKDADSLFEAYNNLQAEFTRKSQKLSTAQKELEKLAENANTAPDYLKEDWQDKIDNFMSGNPDAKEYVKEISEVILNDKAVANSPSSLELAWAKVLTNNYSSKEKFLEDDDFVNMYVLQNKKIRSKVIEAYLGELQTNKTVPVISAHKGTAFSLTPKNKPKSLAEAKVLAEQFFKI
jgi:hypothetical protein